MTNPTERDAEPSVPFAVPDIGEREIEAVVQSLRSRWLTTGPKSRLFEERFADAVGGRHAVAVNSCTAALHLALEALEVGRSDRVYMSPYTFAATAEVVRYLGATPVFVDIDEETLNIDLDQLARRIEVDVRTFPESAGVLLPVHIAGVPVEMKALWALARRHGLAVVEDAAHAFPSQRQGITVGWMPEDIRGAVCFSFYATKTITTGEGGMLVTHDTELAERARSMSLHGLSRGAWNRYEAGGTWRYDIVAPGYKYNLTDPAAALGLVQLERAEQMRASRAAIAERYTNAFKGTVSGLQLPVVPSETTSAWHLYIVRAPDEQERDSLIKHLSANGVGSSVHFIPLHLHSYYRQTYGYVPQDYPIATREYERAISLPIFSSMTTTQVDRVIHVVKEWEDAAHT